MCSVSITYMIGIWREGVYEMMLIWGVWKVVKLCRLLQIHSIDAMSPILSIIKECGTP